MWLAGSGAGAAAMTVAVVVTVTVWYYLLLSPFLKQDDDEGGFFGLVCPFGSSVRMSVPSGFGVYNGGGGVMVVVVVAPTLNLLCRIKYVTPFGKMKINKGNYVMRGRNV